MRNTQNRIILAALGVAILLTASAANATSLGTITLRNTGVSPNRSARYTSNSGSSWALTLSGTFNLAVNSDLGTFSGEIRAIVIFTFIDQ